MYALKYFVNEVSPTIFEADQLDRLNNYALASIEHIQRHLSGYLELSGLQCGVLRTILSALYLWTEWLSIKHCDARPGEWMMGFIRLNFADNDNATLTNQQRLSSFIFEVLTPYIFRHIKNDHLESFIVVLGNWLGNANSQPKEDENIFASFVHRIRVRLTRILILCCRCLMLANDRVLKHITLVSHLGTLGQQFLHLHGLAEGLTPSMHITGVKLAKAKHRKSSPGAASDGDWTSASVLSVLSAIKVVEWISRMRRESTSNLPPRYSMMRDTSALAIPGPLTSFPVPPHERCVSSLKERPRCPLCRQALVDPSVCSSGVVCCYVCLRDALQVRAVCPVSGLPCNPADLIKLRMN